jgi:hypothetical protein
MKLRKLSNYSFGGETDISFDEATKKVTEALKEKALVSLQRLTQRRCLRKS